MRVLCFYFWSFGLVFADCLFSLILCVALCRFTFSKLAAKRVYFDYGRTLERFSYFQNMNFIVPFSFLSSTVTYQQTTQLTYLFSH